MSIVSEPQTTQTTIVIGTRSSKLALIQSNAIRDAIMVAHPTVRVTLEHITTKGDIVLDRPLSAIGDKGLFVTELEDAMRAGRVQLAVHSAKDLPSILPEDMVLAAFPRREDPRDALVSLHGELLADLPEGAKVGTSSLRRACQLRNLRPDLRIEDLRGNVDTRLRKLHEGQYDAIVLAAAGLARMGLLHEASELLSPTEQMVPAVAQGILGIEIHANDPETAALLAILDDPDARIAATAERAFLAQIGGGCQVPLAAYAEIQGNQLWLHGMIGARDGRLIRTTQIGTIENPAELGANLAEAMLAEGGRELLELV